MSTKTAKRRSSPKARKLVNKKTGVCVGDKIIAKPCYTPDEVAEILGIGRATVSDKIDSGELPFVALAPRSETVTRTTKDGKEKRMPEIRRLPFDALMKVAPWLKTKVIKAPTV